MEAFSRRRRLGGATMVVVRRKMGYTVCRIPVSIPVEVVDRTTAEGNHQGEERNHFPFLRVRHEKSRLEFENKRRSAPLLNRTSGNKPHLFPSYAGITVHTLALEHLSYNVHIHNGNTAYTGQETPYLPTYLPTYLR
jgi:hypothetical protein